MKNNKNPYVNINNTNNDEGAFGIVKCTEKNIKDLYRLTELFLEIYNILENNEEIHDFVAHSKIFAMSVEDSWAEIKMLVEQLEKLNEKKKQ